MAEMRGHSRKMISATESMCVKRTMKQANNHSRYLLLQDALTHFPWGFVVIPAHDVNGKRCTCEQSDSNKLEGGESS